MSSGPRFDLKVVATVLAYRTVESALHGDVSALWSTAERARYLTTKLCQDFLRLKIVILLRERRGEGTRQRVREGVRGGGGKGEEREKE